MPQHTVDAPVTGTVLSLNAQYEPPPPTGGPARYEGVSHVMVTGTDFDPATATVAVEDVGPAGNRYAFEGQIIAGPSTAKRLLVKVTCKDKPANLQKHTKLKITVSQPGFADRDTGPFPCLLRNRPAPMIDHSCLPKARLVKETGKRAVVMLPGKHFAPVGDAVKCLADVINSETNTARGRWSAVAKQTKKGVRVTLTCEDATVIVPYSASSGSVAAVVLLITLSPDDETTVEVPPLEVEFIDPDADPAP